MPACLKLKNGVWTADPSLGQQDAHLYDRVVWTNDLPPEGVPFTVDEEGNWSPIAPADAAPAAAPAYYRLSQDTLIQRLAALGKWEAFKAALQAASPIAWDRFVCAPYIASTDPMFVERAPEMKLVLGLSDAEFAALVAPEE